MYDYENPQVASQNLDHLGLVGSACHDLGIARKLDNLLGVHEDRRVSPGQAIVAMIINGHGFSARRLYLTRHFFQDKPTALLLGANIAPEDVHYGLVERKRRARQETLAKAFEAHPERFVRGQPKAGTPPTEVWINKPKKENEQANKPSENSLNQNTILCKND
jgi:hypothetical protein